VKIYWYTKSESHNDLNPVSIQKGFYCKNSVISKKILNTTTKDIKRWKQTKELAEGTFFWEFNRQKSITFTVDDLAHPRFGINDTEVRI
jgi:hypothetical protein